MVQVETVQRLGQAGKRISAVAGTVSARCAQEQDRAGKGVEVGFWVAEEF